MNVICHDLFCFFFSSRRRHTIYWRDWSSDVCSSDLVDFVSDDPRFAGTMTMSWAVSEVPDGTRVDIRADDVPDGISAEDHATGLRSSLANLARYLGNAG